MKQHTAHRRILATWLAGILLLATLPCLAAGTEDEIIIRTPEELIALSYSKSETELSANYRLACDLDMSLSTDARPMKPIGVYSGNPSGDIAFTGTFDGDGHAICNLTSTAEALFGDVGEEGTVKNLTLKNASIHYMGNNSYKYPAALVSRNNGLVENCRSVESTVVSDYCSPEGGLVGANFGTVRRSAVIGGSVSFTVSIAGTGYGGFVGNQRGGVIEECFSTASVEAKKWVGGFVGKMEQGVISDCYALGNVTGTEEDGGFVGAFVKEYGAPTTIQNSYAVGNVYASSGGGFAGGKGFSFSTAGTPENCYFNRDGILPDESGSFHNDDAWGKTMSDMQTEDFAAILSDRWVYDPAVNQGYPYLIDNPPAEASETGQETKVHILLADFDKTNYEYYKLAEAFDVAIPKDTVTVRGIMDAAAEAGLCEYTFGTEEKSGQIVTINGITPKAPAGWIFAVNGVTPSVGVNSALLSDGDRLLWFVGTPENGYAVPDWETLENSPSPASYIYIGSPDELLELADKPEKWDGYYRLTADIDMADRDFTPIGSTEHPFTGRFDGDGFTVSNLTVKGDKSSRNLGMFGVIRGARLTDITLENISVTGGSVVGGLAGLSGVDVRTGTVSLIAGCKVDGRVTAIGTDYIRQTDAGGMVGVNDSEKDNRTGKTYSSAIDNCTADVRVTADAGNADKSESGHVGGLVGMNKGTISDSAAFGDVSGGNTTGGFAGTNYGGSIYQSHASGQVTGGYSVGGFAGSLGLYSLTEGCYSTGDVISIGDYSENFGGFAGWITGKVKNSISAGTLTPGWSYNGGFAGRFEGNVWAYREDLRSISGCYGNVVTANGETIKPLGNYIGGVHGPTDAAAAEIGVNQKTALEKIEGLISQTEAENQLAIEARKYKTSAAIPATVPANSDITALVARLNANVSADGEIKTSYRATGENISADAEGYTLKHRPDTDVKETVTLVLAIDGAEQEVPISVSLKSSVGETDSDALLSNIMTRYAKGTEDYWEIAALCAYEEQMGNALLSDSDKKALAAQAVKNIQEKISDDEDGDTTLAMNLIVLRGLGYDPQRIIDADGKEWNGVETLAETPSSGNNGDAYRLLAYTVTGYKNQTEIDRVIERLLDNRIDDRGWSNNKDDGIDPDTTGAVLMGLAGYTQTDGAVKAAVNDAVDYLSSLMETDGNIKSSYEQSNYGTNANTSAVCALGLSALGIDVDGDSRFEKNGITLLQGILSFATEDNSGFVYEYGASMADDMATKQAALAVMSAASNRTVLDFSDKTAEPLNLSENKNPESTEKPDTSGNTGALGNTGSEKKGNGVTLPATVTETASVTVTFTLAGNTDGSEIWIDGKEVTVTEPATVQAVISAALSETGYTAEGLENGYISKITAPDGKTLTAGGDGSMSGWMFTVNGESPNTGISSCMVKDGDTIILYYSDDPGISAFPDVSPEDWFADAAAFVAEKGFMVGDENGNFLPETTLNRAMAVTVLGRCANADETAQGSEVFADILAGEWYDGYVGWAAAQGIVNGTGDGIFAPEDCVTREQIAVMFYRYAALNGENIENGGDLLEFNDSAAVSDWAVEAMSWAVGNGLINGVGNQRLAPQGTANRAQFAVILMRFAALVSQRKG